MAIPKLAEIRLPLLKLLYEHKDKELSIKEIIDTLEKSFDLSPSEKELKYQSEKGEKIFSNRVRWARLHLVDSELAETNTRGTLRITRKGINYWEQHGDNQEELRRHISEFQKKGRSEKLENNEIPETVEELEGVVVSIEERIKNLSEESEENLKLDLINALRKMNPYQFEELVLKLLEKMGYGKGTVTKRSGDGGIDGIINKDQLGLEKIYLQAKRYGGNNSVGLPQINEFIGAIEHEMSGVFITTSTFTKEAKARVEREKGKSVVLVDSEELLKLILKHDIGVIKETTYKYKEVNMESDFFRDIPKDSIS